MAALEHAAVHLGVILVRGDSKLVIMQISGKWKVHGGLYLPYYAKAKELYQKHKERVRMEWIPRGKNDLCDRLSKQVLKDMGVRFRIQPE